MIVTNPVQLNSIVFRCGNALAQYPKQEYSELATTLAEIRLSGSVVQPYFGPSEGFAAASFPKPRPRAALGPLRRFPAVPRRLLGKNDGAPSLPDTTRFHLPACILAPVIMSAEAIHHSYATRHKLDNVSARIAKFGTSLSTGPTAVQTRQRS